MPKQTVDCLLKAAPFDYVRPEGSEALRALLADDGVDSRLIAGGQSLVPLMVMRLVRPARLIDLGRLGELTGLSSDGNTLRIGAMTRQAAVEASTTVASCAPLLFRAMPLIGHQQTRRRGTIGGSLCHADPSAEIPLVSTTLDAVLRIEGQRASRTVPISEFLVDALETSLKADEYLAGIDLPVWTEASVGAAFYEANVRTSDFAIAAAAAQLAVDAGGRCIRIACAIGGASPAPFRCTSVEQALLGTALDDRLIDEATTGISAQLQPGSDIHASASYRRRVAPALLARAIKGARHNAMANEVNP